MKLGIFTDSHYSSEELTCGNRYNSRSLEKIKEAYSFFEKEKCDLIICLGDMTDKEDTSEKETENLREIAAVISASSIRTICVMGNHDAFTYTKHDFFTTLSGCFETKIETDSYVAVQLLEKQTKLNSESIKFMAEATEGSFAYSILDSSNSLWLVRGDSPISLIHIPKYKLYVYASTDEILYKALVDTNIFDEIKGGNFEGGDADAFSDASCLVHASMGVTRSTRSFGLSSSRMDSLPERTTTSSVFSIPS